MKKSVLTLIGSFAAGLAYADTSSENFEITGDALIPVVISSSETLTVQSTLTPLGMIAESENLTVLGGITALTDPAGVTFEITTPPVGATVFVGQPVTLSVEVVGPAGLTYQWSRDDAAIEGAVMPTLPIPMAAEADAGSYTVAITAGDETIVSEPVTVTVLAVPQIAGPASVATGLPFTLTAAPAPAGAVFEWSIDGNVIAGITGDSYPVAAAVEQDGGSYTVTTTVGGASATSEAFVVTVTPAGGLFALPEPLLVLPDVVFVEDRTVGDATASIYDTPLGQIFVEDPAETEGWVYATELGWIFPTSTTDEGGLFFYSLLLEDFVYTDATRFSDSGFVGFVFGGFGEGFFPNFNDAADNQIWIFQYAIDDWVLIP